MKINLVALMYLIYVGLFCGTANAASEECTLQLKQLQQVIKDSSKLNSDAVFRVRDSAKVIDSIRVNFAVYEGKNLYLPYGATSDMATSVDIISKSGNSLEARGQQIQSNLVDILLNLSGCIQ